MALVLADRVKETTTTVGTGTLTLAGAAAGFQSFASIGNANTTYYAIESGTSWEVGIGTYTLVGTTLSRDTVIASSAAGARITVVSGASVFVTYPAGKAIAAGTGYFTDLYAGAYVDGVVIDYSSPNGRISVGGADGIQFFNGGPGGTKLGEALNTGDWNLTGVLEVGTATALGGATNPLISANGDANNYVQVYSNNTQAGTSASADLIAYASGSTDAHGWADLGFTSAAYADTTYTVTGPHEAYIFGSAPASSGHTGNLVYATDSTGTANAHQWYIGGFTQAKSAYKLQLSSSGFDIKTAITLTGAAGTSGQVLTSGGAGVTPTWTTVSGGGGSPGGSSGQVQYNSTGTFAGATNVTIDNSDLTLLSSPTPVTPPTATVKLFNRQVANRNMPAFVGPSGVDSALQPFFARNKVGIYLPQGGAATLPGSVGLGFTTSVGTATASTIAATNALTRMRRLGFVSAATAGSLAHIRSGTGTTGAVMVSTGDAATYALGGFHYVVRFGISDAATVTGARMFHGLAASTAAPTNVEPNTLVNCVGIAQLSTDATQLYLVYGGTAAQTAIALGATNFPINTTTPYELALFSPISATGTVYYQATNLANGNSVSGTLTGAAAVVPAATVLLTVHNWRTNNATALAVGFDVCSIYLETDQ